MNYYRTKNPPKPGPLFDKPRKNPAGRLSIDRHGQSDAATRKWHETARQAGRISLAARIDGNSRGRSRRMAKGSTSSGDLATVPARFGYRIPEAPNADPLRVESRLFSRKRSGWIDVSRVPPNCRSTERRTTGENPTLPGSVGSTTVSTIRGPDAGGGGADRTKSASA